MAVRNRTATPPVLRQQAGRICLGLLVLLALGVCAAVVLPAVCLTVGCGARSAPAQVSEAGREGGG